MAVTMPYGIHSGKRLRAIPTPHFTWLIGRDWLHEWLRQAITEALTIRMWTRLLSEARAQAQAGGNNGDRGDAIWWVGGCPPTTWIVGRAGRGKGSRRRPPWLRGVTRGVPRNLSGLPLLKEVAFPFVPAVEVSRIAREE